MKNISVIIPVFNAEKALQNILGCIEKQSSAKNLEFVIVDDGSTDRSSELLRGIKQKNVKVITQKNSGVSSARNNGIRSASYDFITFLDADDYVDDDFYETIIGELNAHECDLLVTGYIAEYSDGSRTTKRNEERIISGTEAILKDYYTGRIDPNCWNKVFKKKIIDGCLFDEGMSIGEDKDMLFRYLSKCATVYVDDKSGYHYCIDDESAMRKRFKPESFITIVKSVDRENYAKKWFPKLYEYAYSSSIDTKCRVLCDIYRFGEIKKYENECRKIRKDIVKCSILRKKKYSSRKHFFAYLAIRISPRLYVFIKDKMKMQYR